MLRHRFLNESPVLAKIVHTHIEIFALLASFAVKKTLFQWTHYSFEKTGWLKLD
jgi:hypothetical protein